MVEISTLDHPGLLARVGGLFMMQGLDIHSARIATLGERAEDIFSLSPKDGGNHANHEEVKLFSEN